MGLGRGPCSLYRAGSGEVRCCMSEQGTLLVPRQQRKATPHVSLGNVACKRPA